jgi:hypothetical protein
MLADGRDGKLLARCFGGCEWADVFAGLRSLGLIGTGPVNVGIDPEGRRSRQEAEDETERLRRGICAARDLYRRGIDPYGTPVEIYLRSRRITGPIPTVLRFLDHCPHRNGGYYPAMLAPIVNVDGHQIAAHKTFLTPEGGKADLPKGEHRETRGPMMGGAVRLTSHQSDSELIVGEGIESTLSAMQLLACRVGLRSVPAASRLSNCRPKSARSPLPPTTTKTALVSVPLCLLKNDGLQTGAGSEHCYHQMPEQISTTYYSGLGNKMANGLGGDSKSFERSPMELAQEIAVRKKKPNGTGDGEVPAWGDPDLGVLRLHRRPPPLFPIEVFGSPWEQWICNAAAAAACPADYVVAPLLASVSVLIGHARWAQATAGWAEPSHLWIGAAGDSGDGKSPGADCLLRDVLPEIERRMVADFPDKLREWRAAVEFTKAAEEKWKDEVRAAHKRGTPAPLPPPGEGGSEPQSPRLRQSDVTVEKVASLLATAAPKGVVIVRDELAGWIAGMNAYNDAGRAFWLEAYGGRPYRVERQKHPEPIVIPRLAVAVYGTTQPDRLAQIMSGADDGLLARVLWLWPDPVEFRLARETPDTAWAIDALDRLRELDLQADKPPKPIKVPLSSEARQMMEVFAREMQERKGAAGGLLRTAYGKARGQVLRLALNLEFLWWCGDTGMTPPPMTISQRAFAAAALLVSDYFIPMAERIYGDAAATTAERNAATLARWLRKTRPDEVHVRNLQREVRLPGLKSADDIRAAADVLVEADWLRSPASGTEFGQRGRISYAVNPRLWGGHEA